MAIRANLGAGNTLSANLGGGNDITANIGGGSGLVADLGEGATAPPAPLYCAAYQTIYDEYDNDPGDANALIDNTMVCGLADDGVWAKLDVWIVLANHITGADSLRNWITPANNIIRCQSI